MAHWPPLALLTRPSSSACHGPSHGRRVQGALGVACDRFGTRRPLPGDRHL